MSDPVWRRIGMLRRVLAPDEPPENMSAEDDLLYQVKKHGLSALLEPSEGEQARATPKSISVEAAPDPRPEPAAPAGVDPPQPVEATPPPAPAKPPAPEPWWEAQLRYRPRRGPYAEDVPEEPEREPGEEDDDLLD